MQSENLNESLEDVETRPSRGKFQLIEEGGNAAQQAELQAYVKAENLLCVGARPGIGTYIRRIWKYRQFIYFQSRLKAFAAGHNTVLGNLWLILNPLISGCLFILIFGVLLGLSRGIDNFIAYVIIGVSMFPFLNESLTSGSRVIDSNRNLIRAFAFPRAALVLADLTRRQLDLLPVLVANLVLIWAVPPHSPPSWTWFLLIPLQIIVFLFCFGLMCLVAQLTVIWKDLKHVWPLLGRVWFYCSGVFFSLERLGDHGIVNDILHWNPGAVFLNIYRDVLIYDSFGTALDWGRGLIWAVALPIIGFVLFWISEERYAKVD